MLFLFRQLAETMLKDPQAWITHIESWNDYYLFSIDSPEIASEAQPGQFLMIKVNDSPYPLLRRPFSIHARSKGIIEVFFKVSGEGTSLLARKKTNEPLDILGPLGKGFRFDCELQGKTVCLVGGGRGIAPLFFLAQELQNQSAKIRVFYGGQCLEDLPLRERFKKAGFDLSCSSDDGSLGFRGLVSDLFVSWLEKEKPAAIFSCGPEPMMARIARLALDRNIPAQFSLESQMGCGFGACWGCVKRIKKGGVENWVKICEEGPVFSAEETVWAEEER